MSRFNSTTGIPYVVKATDIVQLYRDGKPLNECAYGAVAAFFANPSRSGRFSYRLTGVAHHAPPGVPILALDADDIKALKAAADASRSAREAGSLENTTPFGSYASRLTLLAERAEDQLAERSRDTSAVPPD